MPETSTASLLHALPDGYRFATAKGSITVHIMHRTARSGRRNDSACKQLRSYGAPGLREQDGPAPEGMTACLPCHHEMHELAKNPPAAGDQVEQHKEDLGIGVCRRQGVLIAECDPAAHQAWHRARTPLTVDHAKWEQLEADTKAKMPKTRKPRRDKGIPRGPKAVKTAKPAPRTSPAKRTSVVSVVEAVPLRLRAEDQAWLDRTVRHIFEGKPLGTPSVQDQFSAGRVALHLATNPL